MTQVQQVACVLLSVLLLTVPTSARASDSNRYELYIGLTFWNCSLDTGCDSDATDRARSLVSRQMIERERCLAICQTGGAKGCETRCEIAFRHELTTIPYVAFQLPIKPPNATHVDVETYLPLSSNDAMNPELDRHFYHFTPGNYAPLGVYVTRDQPCLFRYDDASAAGYQPDREMCSGMELYFQENKQ
jgi:hypothetical protein